MAKQLIMAKSPEEAVSCKASADAYLAGGTEVNRLGSDIATNADKLISLKKCSGLSDINSSGVYVTIGSMCTFQDLVESDKVPGYLKEAALFMGSRTKRNMATIGGNIAAKRDDSYLIPVLSAAGALLELLDKNGKVEKVGIEQYTSGSYDSLIKSITVLKDIKVVSKRYSNTVQSHAVLTMSAAKGGDGIHINGALKNTGLLHFTDLEAKFRKDPDVSEEEIIKMVKECTGLKATDDMFGSEEYKRYLIAVTALDLHARLTGKGAKR